MSAISSIGGFGGMVILHTESLSLSLNSADALILDSVLANQTTWTKCSVIRFGQSEFTANWKRRESERNKKMQIAP